MAIRFVRKKSVVKVAVTPLNLTSVASPKNFPLITTEVPAGPLAGEKLVMKGGPVRGKTTKSLADVTVPSRVDTVISPVVAPCGTEVVICDPKKVKVAGTPLNLTEIVPLRFSPFSITLVPTGPLEGEKLLIEGGGRASPTAAYEPGVIGHRLMIARSKAFRFCTTSRFLIRNKVFIKVPKRSSLTRAKESSSVNGAMSPRTEKGASPTTRRCVPLKCQEKPLQR